MMIAGVVSYGTADVVVFADHDCFAHSAAAAVMSRVSRGCQALRSKQIQPRFAPKQIAAARVAGSCSAFIFSGKSLS